MADSPKSQPGSTPSPAAQSNNPKLSVAPGNKVQVEFQIDDLISRLGLPGREASHCGGCNGCTGCAN